MANYAPKKKFLSKRDIGSDSDPQISPSHLEFNADVLPVEPTVEQPISSGILYSGAMVNFEGCYPGQSENCSPMATFSRGAEASSTLAVDGIRLESRDRVFHAKHSTPSQANKSSGLQHRSWLHAYSNEAVYFDAEENRSMKEEMSSLRGSSLHHNMQFLQPTVPSTTEVRYFRRQDNHFVKQSNSGASTLSEAQSRLSNSTFVPKKYNSSDELAMAVASSSNSVCSMTYLSSLDDANHAGNWQQSSDLLLPTLDNIESDESNSCRIESGIHSKIRVCQSDERGVIRYIEQPSSSPQNQYSRPFRVRGCTESSASSQMSSNEPSSSGDVCYDVTDDKELPSRSAKESTSSPSTYGQPQFRTTSGRNRGRGKANEPKYECQVCGDVAAGFHCGAYVCEACKKFYLRCLKMRNNPPFFCPKSNNCKIIKETRSHCQYCRFQKCTYLGMYKPGCEVDKKLKVNFRSISCKVCNAPSSGFHFGAITCEGCKGFFRRMLKEQFHTKFVCANAESCVIDSANRTNCKCCRFAKCVRVGMTLDGTRLGRQSNSVKLSTLMQYHSDAPEEQFQPDSAIEKDVSQQMYSLEDYSNDDDDDGDDEDSSFLENDLHSEMPLNDSQRSQKGSSECSRVTSEQDPPAYSSQIYTHKSFSSTALDSSDCRTREHVRHAVSSCSHDSSLWDHRGAPFGLGNSMSYVKSSNISPHDQDDDLVHKLSFSANDQFSLNVEENLTSRQQTSLPKPDDSSSSQQVAAVCDQQQKLNEKLYGVPKQSVQSSRPYWHGIAGTALTSQLRCDMFNASRNASTSQNVAKSISAVPRVPSADAASKDPIALLSSGTMPHHRVKNVLSSMQSRVRTTSGNSFPTGDALGRRLVCFLDTTTVASIITANECNSSGHEGNDSGSDISMYDRPRALFSFLSDEFTKLDQMMYRPTEMDALQNRPATWESLWKFVELVFMHQARAVLQFIKKIPGFRQLPSDDQIRIAQDALYPVLLIFHSQYYNMQTGNHNYFICTPEECELMIRLLPPFAKLRSHFASTGFSLQQLNMSSTEITFLSAMTVLTAVELKSPPGTVNLEDLLLKAFVEQCPDQKDAFKLSLLLARLPELRRANIEHELIVNQVQQMIPHLRQEAVRSGASLS